MVLYWVVRYYDQFWNRFIHMISSAYVYTACIRRKAAKRSVYEP